MKPLIEVELRGLMTEDQYQKLIRRLNEERVPVEADDKDTYFFNVPRGIFKVCDEVSKDQGKLSLKLGDEETGALQELEIPFDRAEVPQYLKFFAALGYDKFHLVPQKRQNFFLPDATLSLKYTEDFRHHFELEGELLEDEADVPAERERLKELCREYGLTPLEPAEIAARVAEIKKRIGFGNRG